MNEIGKELVAKYYKALADADVEAFLAVQQEDVVYNVNGSTPSLVALSERIFFKTSWHRRFLADCKWTLFVSLPNGK